MCSSDPCADEANGEGVSTCAFASGFLQVHIAVPPPAQSPGSSTCLQLPFASVGLGLDFARYACHNIGHHHLAAGPSPAHNKQLHSDVRKQPFTRPSRSGKMGRTCYEIHRSFRPPVNCNRYK